MKKDYWLYLAAAAGGAAVWIVIAAASGRREAWDSGLYFSAGIPAVAVLSIPSIATARLGAWVRTRQRAGGAE